MPHQPSATLIAKVEQSAAASWKRQVDLCALKYERGKLADMGVIVPPHTLHDYGEQATRVIVEAIKLRKESATRMWGRRGVPGWTAAYHLAPLAAALQVEEGRLARLERRAA